MSDFYDEENQDIYHIRTHAAGPRGELPLTPAMLINRPSGDLFGMTMNAGIGWNPDELDRDEVLLVSTALTESPSRLRSIRVTMSSTCSCARRLRKFMPEKLCLMRSTSPTPATAAPRARSACSTRSPTATTRAW